MVNTPDCGSGMRGFDPHHSPILYYSGYSQAVGKGTLTPSCVGSNPALPQLLFAGVAECLNALDSNPVSAKDVPVDPAASIVIKTRVSFGPCF